MVIRVRRICPAAPNTAGAEVRAHIAATDANRLMAPVFWEQLVLTIRAAARMDIYARNRYRVVPGMAGVVVPANTAVLLVASPLSAPVMTSQVPHHHQVLRERQPLWPLPRQLLHQCHRHRQQLESSVLTILVGTLMDISVQPHCHAARDMAGAGLLATIAIFLVVANLLTELVQLLPTHRSRHPPVA